MWKKGDADHRSEPEPRPVGHPASVPAAPSPHRGGDRASIGPSIIIKGDVSGEEDLIIQGRVEGTVDLGTHRVTIGPEGRVTADVSGRTVTVQGEVRGNLRGQEQIVLCATARVEGNIHAPRVTVEDGAAFRGSIDMGRDPLADVGRKGGRTTADATAGTAGKPSAAQDGGAPPSEGLPAAPAGAGGAFAAGAARGPAGGRTGG